MRPVGTLGTEDRWPWWATAMLWAGIAVGWFLIVWNVRKPITLHGDEAMLLLNIVELDVLDYAGPLKHYQIAPFGFMAMVRAAIALFGLSEWSVRLVPALAAAASLPLFAVMVRRLCAPLAGLLVTAGFVGSQEWILQACRVKPYTLDVFLTLVMLMIGLRLLDRRCSWRAAAGAAVVAAVGTWCSVAFYLVLPAVGLFLLASRFWGPARRDWLRLITIGLVGAAAGAVHYFWVLKVQEGAGDTAQYMSAFWARGFLPVPFLDPRRFAVRLQLSAGDATQLALPGLVLGLALLGLAAAVAQRSARGLLIAAPLLLASLASMLWVYPLAHRLALFIAPSLYLLLAWGLTTVQRSVGGRLGVVAVLIAGALMLSKPFDGRGQAIFEDDLAPVLRQVHAQLEPDQRIYLYYGGENTYDFYAKHLAPELAFDENRLTRGQSHRDNWLGFDDEIRTLAQTPGEVWLVFSHVTPFSGVDERKYFRLLLDRYGQSLRRIDEIAAYAVLWQPTPTPAELPSNPAAVAAEPSLGHTTATDTDAEAAAQIPDEPADRPPQPAP
ncbi:MAG: glycosyltransferase family 39 protein [Planctomycetota bacterium]